MKILFLTRYEYMEPIGMMALSAFLKQNGHESDMVDLSLSKDYLPEIRAFNPDTTRFSVTTGREFFYLSLNRELKDRFSFTAVFGGPHATFFPKTIEEEGWI
jgi:anaerobic magnesium-protoporphyrin IX monomethyl ester cyclase